MKGRGSRQVAVQASTQDGRQGTIEDCRPGRGVKIGFIGPEMS